MKQETIRNIIHEINSSSAPSGHVIGAVAKLAAYEAMSGTIYTSYVHLTGLNRMVVLRGGLEAVVTFLDGLLVRMI